MVEQSIARATGFVRLADGRRLAYAEWGDPHGLPVIHHHGMPGSRHDHAAGEAVYRRLGVRLITPDRPGYGLSDALRNRTLLDWPQDVAALADHLGLSRFAITALSGGGIYALACARAIPERLTEVVLVGCPAPLDRPNAMREMRLENKVGLRAAAVPWLARGVVGALSGAVRRYPSLFLAEGTRSQPAADRLWTSRPWVRSDEIRNLREAFRQGGLAYTQDLGLLVRPWGFALEDVDPRVQLWHGDADRVIPLHHARYLASALQNATLQVCPDEGHMLLWNHVEEILAAATTPRHLRLLSGGGYTPEGTGVRAVSSQR